MKSSLRQTASHLHLAYRQQETADGLLGRHFVLDVQGRLLLLGIDLSANFHARTTRAPNYRGAVNLEHNHRLLRYVQCNDNLVRSRLIKVWERVERPELRMTLDLGERGCLTYTVLPHSLFMGGIQFDVQEMLGVQLPTAVPAIRVEPDRSVA